LDVRKAPEADSRDTAGQSFVKRIGPAGMVLFLALAVLVGMICLTSGRDPIPGYEAPQSAEYYAAHLDELARELTENVFPALPDYRMTAEPGEDVVTVTVEDGNFAAARAAVLRYFPQNLLDFRRG
jgi:hypothetical protein